MPAMDWFPDWSGCAAVIVASGPSAKNINLDILREKSRVKVVAIKESYRLCQPDVIYGCDAHWWRANNGLPEYRGIKIAWEAILSEVCPDIRLIRIDVHNDKMLFDTPGLIGSGGNSGFQALNLCLQFGARLIVLVGFDLHDKSGLHWYGRNGWNGANNPSEANFFRWRKAFKIAAPIIANLPADVANATRYSECKAFRFVPSVEVALQEWKM
jgi:hypothetical protein